MSFSIKILALVSIKNYLKLIFDYFNFLETPFGHVPVLEIDGKMHVESLAIARYIANEVQLSGQNSLENLEIDSIVEALNDFSTSTYITILR